MKKIFAFPLFLSFVITLSAQAPISPEKKTTGTTSEAKPKTHFVSSTFVVTGMFCEACPKRVEALLKRNKAIQAATVTYSDKKAVVEYNPAETTPGDIKKSMEGSAYTLSSPAPEPVKKVNKTN